MQILARFTRVWHPDFLTRFLADTKGQAGRSWAFWFLSNTLIVVLATIAAATLLAPAVQNVSESVAAEWANVPAFEASVADGKLTTDLPQPFTYKFLEGQFIFAVDLEEKQYKKGNVLQLPVGVYLFQDVALAKQPDGKINTLNYKEILRPLHFTKASITTAVAKIVPVAKNLAVAAFLVVLWFLLAVFRLLSALFWAGVLAISARFSHLQISYGTAYLAVLNLAFVPTVLGLALALLGVQFWLPLSALAFVVVVGGNLWWLKKHGHKTHA